MGSCHLPPATTTTFGIRIATYQRPGGTLHLLHRCLKSILSQTYPYWKVFLIGDCYEPDEELQDIAQIIPKDKLYLENLPFSPERKKYSVQDLWKAARKTDLKDIPDLWKVAGCTASRIGLRKIQEEELIHAPIDDDDWWLENHLETLAKGYPEAAFVFTQATYKDGVLPKKEGKLQAYGLIHSAVSWDTKRIPLQYPNIIEEGSEFVAGDAEMWERMRIYCKDNNLKVLYIPKLTVMHYYEHYDKIVEPLLL